MTHAPINNIHMQVESALALDLWCVPRIHRLNLQIRIPINKKKQATSDSKGEVTPTDQCMEMGLQTHSVHL